MHCQVLAWIEKSLEAGTDSFIISFFRCEPQPFRNAVYVSVNGNRLLFCREEKDNICSFWTHAGKLHERVSCFFEWERQDWLKCAMILFLDDCCCCFNRLGFILIQTSNIDCFLNLVNLSSRKIKGSYFETFREAFESPRQYSCLPCFAK